MRHGEIHIYVCFFTWEGDAGLLCTEDREEGEHKEEERERKRRRERERERTLLNSSSAWASSASSISFFFFRYICSSRAFSFSSSLFFSSSSSFRAFSAAARGSDVKLSDSLGLFLPVGSVALLVASGWSRREGSLWWT